jgi:predicted secreted protein
MRTSTGISAGLGTGIAAGLCLLMSGCGGGGRAGATPAASAAPGAPVMAPVVQAPTAPGRPDVIADYGRNGSRVPLRLGQSLEIRLEGNPSTGNVWDLTQLDTDVLRRDTEVTYTPHPLATPRPGSGGVFTARFTAVRPGETDLRLVYHRPFDHGGTPGRTFGLHVTVTTG